MGWKVYFNKNDVLMYLNSFPPKWVTSARIIDKGNGMAVMDIVNNSFSVGEYEWSASDIYYFEKTICLFLLNLSSILIIFTNYFYILFSSNTNI